MDGKSIQPTNSQNSGNVDDPGDHQGIAELNLEPEITDDVARKWAELNKQAGRKGLHRALRPPEAGTFFSERMDFENCSLFHPVYFNDYSSWCLK